MTAWSEVESAQPEFALRVRALFEAHRHKTMATVRADGSPRISGIEAEPVEGQDGDHFHADIAEVVHTHLDEKATMLVIEWWTAADGLRRVSRA